VRVADAPHRRREEVILRRAAVPAVQRALLQSVDCCGLSPGSPAPADPWCRSIAGWTSRSSADIDFCLAGCGRRAACRGHRNNGKSNRGGNHPAISAQGGPGLRIAATSGRRFSTLMRRTGPPAALGA